MPEDKNGRSASNARTPPDVADCGNISIGPPVLHTYRGVRYCAASEAILKAAIQASDEERRRKRARR